MVFEKTFLEVIYGLWKNELTEKLRKLNEEV
jgi:hypothetical protein